MIEYKFDDTKILVCEDTARCLISFPTQDNKNQIIDFIAKSNFITAGVYCNDIDLLKEMNFYLAGEMITEKQQYNLLEKQFT